MSKEIYYQVLSSSVEHTKFNGRIKKFFKKLLRGKTYPAPKAWKVALNKELKKPLDYTNLNLVCKSFSIPFFDESNQTEGEFLKTLKKSLKEKGYDNSF